MSLRDNVKRLIEQGDKLFSQRSGLVSVWQEISENFYPERADFTTIRKGSSLFDNAALMTSAPALIRRDLGNTLSAMLRPRGEEWFRIRTSDDRINEDPGAKKWLDWATDVQRKVIYDKRAHFVRSTKEGDHDFASFGQAVLTVDVNKDLDGLLYRAWHLRDVVWSENASLEIDTVHRNWKVQARNLKSLFPDKVDAKVTEAAEKEPFKEISAGTSSFRLTSGKSRTRSSASARVSRSSPSTSTATTRRCLRKCRRSGLATSSRVGRR